MLLTSKFFFLDKFTYLILLGQPFINASKKQLNILDNRSAHVQIKSRDVKETVQILIICKNPERNREKLREITCKKYIKKLEDSRNFHRMQL